MAFLMPTLPRLAEDLKKDLKNAIEKGINVVKVLQSGEETWCAAKVT